MVPLWIFGMSLSIIGSVWSNLGLNLQKYSFLNEAKRIVNDKRTYWRQPKWVSGMVLVVTGNLGDIVALGLAPQSLITPVGGGSGMIVNAILAHYFLNETFQRRDAIATALIVGGVVQVALFADKSDTSFTLAELEVLFCRAAFVAYVAIVGVVCIFLIGLVRHVELLYESFGSRSSQYAGYKRIHPVLYPVLSGLFGAQSSLFAKSTAELIRVTFTEGDSQFTHFGTYLIVCSLLVCVFLQIHWLAQGLQRFDAIFIVPVFQCSCIITSIVGGGLYFEEFKGMSFLRILMFTVGVASTLGGVILLSQRPMNEPKPLQKLRASVRAVIFIKRVQKDVGMQHRWAADSEIVADRKTIERETDRDGHSSCANYRAPPPPSARVVLPVEEAAVAEEVSLLTCLIPQSSPSLSTEVIDLEEHDTSGIILDERIVLIEAKSHR